MSVSVSTFPVSLPAVPETAGTLTLTDEVRQAMVDHALAGLPNAVSYTHLTLPTICSV